MTEPEEPGTRVYTCPDCGGALSELIENGLLRFRCKVGHAYSQESLLYSQSEQLETALWAALRSLEDRVELTNRLARRLRDRGGADRAAARFEQQSADAFHHAGLLRRTLEEVEAIEQPDPASSLTENGR